MLRNSFQIFSGITPKWEKWLWEQHIHEWKDLFAFLERGVFPELFPKSTFSLCDIEEAEKRWQEQDWFFFETKLPQNELWRLFPWNRENFLFFDIETTGLGERDFVTVASFYFQNHMDTRIRGSNLETLMDAWDHSKILVSYNGKRFDQPFLEKEFQIKMKNPHLDLMHLLHSLNIKGGLKKSELQIGLSRPESLRDMDGSFAPLLWKEYVERDSKEALDRLVEYNQTDTFQLEKILEWIVKSKQNAI